MPESSSALPENMTLRELHNLLWDHPLATVARKLGCDPVWLAEFCAYAAIPLPTGDYWKKKRAGKRVHQRWLPKALDPRQAVRALVEKHRQGQPAVPEVPIEQDVADLVEEIGRLEVHVAPPESTGTVHPVVAASRRVMRKHARNEWPTRFNRLRRHEGSQEPVFIAEVGPETVGRATQLLQTLVEAVIDLGGSIDTSHGDVACVDLLGELHGLRLRERLQRHREPGAVGERAVEVWRPSGALELHLEAWPSGQLLTKWADGSHGTIEAQITSILVAFVKQVQATRAKNALRRCAEEEVRREREARRRGAEEAERARHRTTVLRDLAERYDASLTMKKLLHACRHDGPLPGDLERWLQLAEAGAEELNPLGRGVAALRDLVEKGVDEKMQNWHWYDWGR